jgi:hypothetical protein
MLIAVLKQRGIFGQRSDFYIRTSSMPRASIIWLAYAVKVVRPAITDFRFVCGLPKSSNTVFLKIDICLLSA